MAKGAKLDPQVAAELQEPRKLRKEHARLQMERDIPKKAIAVTSARRAKSSPSSSTVVFQSWR
jgi:transposase